MKKIITLLVLTSGLACNNFKSFNPTDYLSVTFGTYCGECNGKCFQGYILKNDSAFRLGLPSNDIEHVNFDTVKEKELLDKSETAKIRDIIKLLPSNIDSYDETIGQPDNHDQCGIMIFLFNKTRHKKILIDTDKQNCPTGLHKFIDAVTNLKLL